MRAQLVRRRLDRIAGIEAEMSVLRAQIKTAVAASQTSLVELYGAVDLVTARILAEVVDEIRADTDGRAYYRRKRAEGKTGCEALRCLKRRLTDQVYKTMRADLDRSPAEDMTAPALITAA